MRDFWMACGHRLLDHNASGGLVVTDEFLKAYFARPELMPPNDACEVERRPRSCSQTRAGKSLRRNDRRTIVELLAKQLVERFGAPDLATALIAADAPEHLELGDPGRVRSLANVSCKASSCLPGHLKRQPRR